MHPGVNGNGVVGLNVERLVGGLSSVVLILHGLRVLNGSGRIK